MPRAPGAWPSVLPQGKTGGMAFELTDQIERHLTGDQVAWLTTVTRPGGRHRPVWFVWDGSAITIHSLNDGAKLRRLQVNDQVAVHFKARLPTAVTSW